MNGWTVFFLLLGAYLVVAYSVGRREDDDEPGRPRTLELAGPFLLWRTQRGRDLINRIAQRKRLWAFFGDAGIAVTVISGLLVFALLIYQLVLFLVDTQQVVQNAPEPQLLIGLPGVNPLIPIWYGIFGLLVALVVHEGCHGILARVADLRVKSLGLLFFIVPIGAFVEPHEEDLERATTREKNRVFSAGPMSNIVLATLAAIVFSSLLMSQVAVVNGGEGVGVVGAVEGYPAAEAGLEPGWVITRINSEPVTNLTEFNEALQGKEAGTVVTVVAVRDGEERQFHVRLADKYDYYQEAAPELNRPEYKGQGFLGVTAFPLSLVSAAENVLTHPIGTGLGGFLFFISYPFFVLRTQVDLLNAPFNDFLVTSGAADAMGASFWVLANAFYWIFWLNLMLGTFNALPAGPLDGGQMFKASLRETLIRYFNVDRDKLVVESDALGGHPQMRGADAETQGKLDRINGIVSRATWTLGLFILALILMPVVAPRLITLLG